MRTRALAACTLFAVVSAGLAACGSDASAAPNAADRTFLQEMIPHHERAIEVARIGESAASDPRVRAFAQRIVKEQSPELARMQAAAKGRSLDLAAGTLRAMHRITDAQVAALRTMTGAAFDRQFVSLNITSEQGAYAMARTELTGGREKDAEAVARGISHSPSEIAELRTLLAALG